MRAKPRAKLPPLRTVVDRVLAYAKEHPEADAKQTAKALGVKIEAVYNANMNIRKLSEGGESVPLEERDILAVARIGLPKVERIVRLLKILPRG
jgi:hypothetical protein